MSEWPPRLERKWHQVGKLSLVSYETGSSLFSVSIITIALKKKKEFCSVDLRHFSLAFRFEVHEFKELS